MGITSRSRHDSFDYIPPAQQKRKLWDPIATLDIINPSRGCLTCVGYAPSCGRRCHNAIKQANRESAFEILEDLSYIDTSTTDINAKLHQLAQLTLCRRLHQDQKYSMVEKWSKNISQQQTASRNSASAKSDMARMEEQLRDMEELLARLRHKTKGADEFISSSPAGQRYRKQCDQQSTNEERARKRREEEARKLKEQERERERARQQQEREKRAREEKERQKREEEKERRKREEEKEQKKREEEKERKKCEEEKQRKKEQEAREREAREREERNERIRQRAEQARKERERKAKEQAAKEREEWDKIWLDYVLRWDDIKKNGVKATLEKLREIIPWPVKSGDSKDVSGPAVEEFFRKAPPQETSAEKMFLLMKMECLKWHADRIPRMFGPIEDKAFTNLFNTVAQVAIKIRAETVHQRER